MIIWIETYGRIDYDSICRVAVRDQVINSLNGNDLRHIPVSRGEDQVRSQWKPSMGLLDVNAILTSCVGGVLRTDGKLRDSAQLGRHKPVLRADGYADRSKECSQLRAFVQDSGLRRLNPQPSVPPDQGKIAQPRFSEAFGRMSADLS